MFIEANNQMRVGFSVAALLMVLTSISTEATTDVPGSTYGWVHSQTFGTKSHDSEHLCGQSPLRNEAGNAGAAVGGAAGAWVGAEAGAVCDVLFLGFTLGACTLAGAAIGALASLIIAREVADEVDGYSHCAGGMVRREDGRYAMIWDRDSTEAVHLDYKSIFGSDSTLLAIFETRQLRCGSIVKGPSGRRFSGVGRTVDRAEYDAMHLCRTMENDECEVVITGKCNAWRRPLDK